MSLPSRIGRYEVELLLGEGGIARVLLARDPVLGRPVALKVIRDDLGLTPNEHLELTERIRSDARAASTLSHPAIVGLHDMGDDQGVGLYLVFELARGPTLRERLQEGPLPPSEVAQIARAVGSALTHAHTRGLIHRGVKPENVMLAPTGAKLTDFGLSDGALRAPAFCPPEVLSLRAFSAESDQFSLGTAMYEALTGVPAFPGDDAAAVAASVSAGKYPPPRSALPRLHRFTRLDLIFARALAKDPKKRFPSCEVFGSALSAELDRTRGAFLTTPVPRSSASRATRRRQNSLALVAFAVIFVLVAIGRLQQTKTDGSSVKKVANVPANVNDPGSSMQRVVRPSHPPESAASTAHASSATRSSSGVILPTSNSAPVIAP
ncbi:MAG: serine/threonine protein kinase [Myxococcota bacterium]|nr:serine/threonine protein kinase [Myxococcota bacterium]